MQKEEFKIDILSESILKEVEKSREKKRTKVGVSSFEEIIQNNENEKKFRKYLQEQLREQEQKRIEEIRLKETEKKEENLPKTIIKAMNFFDKAYESMNSKLNIFVEMGKVTSFEEYKILSRNIQNFEKFINEYKEYLQEQLKEHKTLDATVKPKIPDILTNIRSAIMNNSNEFIYDLGKLDFKTELKKAEIEKSKGIVYEEPQVEKEQKSFLNSIKLTFNDMFNKKVTNVRSSTPEEQDELQKELDSKKQKHRGMEFWM